MWCCFLWVWMRKIYLVRKIVWLNNHRHCSVLSCFPMFSVNALQKLLFLGNNNLLSVLFTHYLPSGARRRCTTWSKSASILITRLWEEKPLTLWMVMSGNDIIRIYVLGVTSHLFILRCGIFGLSFVLFSCSLVKTKNRIQKWWLSALQRSCLRWNVIHVYVAVAFFTCCLNRLSCSYW